LGTEPWSTRRGDRHRGVESWHVRPIWNLYYRFTSAAWGHGFATEAAREALIVAAERDPKRRVVVRTTPATTERSVSPAG
jgi:RimJ/RimL family protein N-acetyltransferase